MDDSSSHTHLGQQLELEVARLPVPVKVLRTGSRSGLIRSGLVECMFNLVFLSGLACLEPQRPKAPSLLFLILTLRQPRAG